MPDSFRKRLSKRLRSSGLRQRLRSSNAYWRLKLFIKRLTGKEIRIRRDVRIAMAGDGDYFYAADGLAGDSVVYSFGVGDSIAFEEHLIATLGVAVHTFDPTPYTLDWLATQKPPEAFRFHPWAVAGSDGMLTLYPRERKRDDQPSIMWTTDPAQANVEKAIEVPAWTVGSLMRELGHDRIDLLKMDVEGAEYDALGAMLDDGIHPRQILVEFHHRFPGIGQQMTLDMLDRLRAAGYRVFWVSYTGREVSLIRTTGA